MKLGLAPAQAADLALAHTHPHLHTWPDSPPLSPCQQRVPAKVMLVPTAAAWQAVDYKDPRLAVLANKATSITGTRKQALLQQMAQYHLSASTFGAQAQLTAVTQGSSSGTITSTLGYLQGELVGTCRLKVGGRAGVEGWCGGCCSVWPVCCCLLLDGMCTFTVGGRGCSAGPGHTCAPRLSLSLWGRVVAGRVWRVLSLWGTAVVCGQCVAACCRCCCAGGGMLDGGWLVRKDGAVGGKWGRCLCCCVCSVALGSTPHHTTPHHTTPHHTTPHHTTPHHTTPHHTTCSQTHGVPQLRFTFQQDPPDGLGPAFFVSTDGGQATAKIVGLYSTCGGTSIYQIDKVLLPCTPTRAPPAVSSAASANGTVVKMKGGDDEGPINTITAYNSSMLRRKNAAGPSAAVGPGSQPLLLSLLGAALAVAAPVLLAML